MNAVIPATTASPHCIRSSDLGKFLGGGVVNDPVTPMFKLERWVVKVVEVVECTWTEKCPEVVLGLVVDSGASSFTCSLQAHSESVNVALPTQLIDDRWHRTICSFGKFSAKIPQSNDTPPNLTNNTSPVSTSANVEVSIIDGHFRIVPCCARLQGVKSGDPKEKVTAMHNTSTIFMMYVFLISYKLL
jgi:hypothetical protein